MDTRSGARRHRADGGRARWRSPTQSRFPWSSQRFPWSMIPLVVGLAIVAVIVLLRSPGSGPGRLMFLAFITVAISHCYFTGPSAFQLYAGIFTFHVWGAIGFLTAGLWAIQFPPGLDPRHRLRAGWPVVAVILWILPRTTQYLGGPLPLSSVSAQMFIADAVLFAVASRHPCVELCARRPGGTPPGQVGRARHLSGHAPLRLHGAARGGEPGGRWAAHGARLGRGVRGPRTRRLPRGDRALQPARHRPRDQRHGVVHDADDPVGARRRGPARALRGPSGRAPRIRPVIQSAHLRRRHGGRRGSRSSAPGDRTSIACSSPKDARTPRRSSGCSRNCLASPRAVEMRS